MYNRSSELSQSSMTSILDFLQKTGSCQEALQEQRAPHTSSRSATDQGHHLDLQTNESKTLIGECISCKFLCYMCLSI